MTLLQKMFSFLRAALRREAGRPPQATSRGICVYLDHGSGKSASALELPHLLYIAFQERNQGTLPRTIYHDVDHTTLEVKTTFFTPHTPTLNCDELLLRSIKGTRAARARRNFQAAGRAQRIFSILDILVPKRIATEEIGDAQEGIARLVKSCQHPCLIYIKVASAAFWISINTIRELTGAFLGRKRA